MSHPHLATSPRRARRRAAVSLVLLTATVSLAVGVGPSAGQQGATATTTSTSPPLTGPPLTTTPPVTEAPLTTSKPEPPPTTNPPSTLAPDPAPTAPPSTVAPGATDPVPPTSVFYDAPDPGPVLPSGPGGGSVEGDTPPTAVTGADSPVPRLNDAQVANILASLVRSGANSTAALLDILRPLLALGISPRDAAMLGMGSFPVAGPATFRDDWHDPRFTPVPHLHQGNDIFAAFGTPARAPVAGTVRFAEGGAGGRAAYVTAPDGTWYYLAHLDAFAPDLANGDAVAKGRAVGFVGDSGNGRGGAPHVHFEIHPGGGEAINPKPVLDAWLAEAVDSAPALITSFIPPAQRVLSATSDLRRLESSPAGASPPAGSVLMWASSVSAGGGTVRLAESAAARATIHLDWWRIELAAQASDSLKRLARGRAFDLLAPLTPAALTPLLGTRALPV